MGSRAVQIAAGLWGKTLQDFHLELYIQMAAKQPPFSLLQDLD